jgi:hypothetical protein
MTKSSVLDRVSTISQFILGFILGILLMGGFVSAIVYFYFLQMSSLPKKPAFPEIEKTAVATSQPTLNDSEDSLNTETVEEELPPNAYKAKVTWPQGLSVRAEPSVDAASITGIGYNSEIIVLEETTDKKWQKIRIPWSEQEGWVRGGNTEKISY